MSSSKKSIQRIASQWVSKKALASTDGIQTVLYAALSGIEFARMAIDNAAYVSQDPKEKELFGELQILIKDLNDQIRGRTNHLVEAHVRQILAVMINKFVSSLAQ